MGTILKDICVLLSILYVILQVTAADDKPVRLAGGTSPYEGRVEILHNGFWGTVCNEQWGMNDAAVVCRQLGFDLATTADSSLEFGPGNGTIWMSNVRCNGNENSLDDCDALWGSQIPSSCSRFDDAGVICSPIGEGAIRLFGGSNRFEGGVEIYISNEWGTICDHGWSANDVKVACRQLGYPQAKSIYLDARRYFGAPRYPYTLEDIGCDGYELEILDCRPLDYSPEFCDPYDLAGLACYENLQSDSGMSASAIAGIIVASTFGLMLICCCCAAVCSSNNRKRTSSGNRRTRNRPTTQQGNINVVYEPESGTTAFQYPSPPSPPGPGINTVPFTPPAGYMPGYVPPSSLMVQPPMPTDAPPAYDTLDKINPPINTINVTSNQQVESNGIYDAISSTELSNQSRPLPGLPTTDGSSPAVAPVTQTSEQTQ